MERPRRICRALGAALAGLPLVPLSGLGWTTVEIAIYFVIVFSICAILDPN